MFDRIYKILGPKSPSEIRKQEKQKRMRFPDPDPDPTDDSAPNTPGNLQATNIQDTAITIQFNRSQDDTPPIVYSIEYRANSTGTYSVQTINQQSGTQTGTTGTTISSLQHSTLYQIRVKATDSSTTGTGAGGTNSSPYTTITATTTTPSDTTDPTTPTSLAYSGVTENTANLTWNGSNDNFPLSGLKYKLYISISGNAYVFEKQVNHVGSAGSQQSTTLTGLVPGRQQELYVIAEDAEGNQSSQSNIIDFTTPDNTAPTAPSNLTTSNITETTIDLSWNASSDVSGVTLYKIYQNGSFIDDVNYPNISYTATGLTQNTSYSFYVTALDTAGNVSANSNTTPTVTTLESIAPPTPTPPSSPVVDDTKYVEYIKIARVDQDGKDNTLTLEALTQITLPFSNGTTGNYKILSTTKYQTYFLYRIANYGPEPLATDAATLDYSFTGSLNTGSVVGPQLGTFPSFLYFSNPIGISSSIEDTANFYNPATEKYELNTYPNKIINIRAKVSLQPTTTPFTSCNIGIFVIPPGVSELTYNPPLTEFIGIDGYNPYLLKLDPNGPYGTGSPGTKNTDFNVDVPAGLITPGSSIEIRAIGGLANAPFTINTGSELMISSSIAAPGSTLPTIPEPYLTSQFYGTDCDVLLNNVNKYPTNPFLQDLDYSTNPNKPVNFSRVLEGTADRGTVPESYYTALSQTRIRYTGVKNQSSDFNIYDPQAGTSSFGEPINIGTYGQTPSISSLDANIYEFEWGGGTTPEILDWGAVKIGRILQVSPKNLVKTINAGENIKTITIPSKRGTTLGRARNYRVVFTNPPATQYPPNSVNTSSVGNVHFWDTPQNVGDYYQILNGNNPVNTEISMFMYPNSTAGSNPTIPSSTKILTTEWCVPSISNYALTSSNSDVYGTIDSNSSPRNSIALDREVKISRVSTDNNGYYSAGKPLKPNHQSMGNQINADLNNGEKWFVTLYNEFEFPEGGGDYNSALTSGSLSPFNIGVTTNNDGNYSNALAYKGVYEIAGTYDKFGFLTILTYDDFPDFGGIMNIGGGIASNSLGMLIWKAKGVGKNEFVLVQDSITGGVGAGAFTNRYAPSYLTENFESITKEFGSNET